MLSGFRQMERKHCVILNHVFDKAFAPLADTGINRTLATVKQFGSVMEVMKNSSLECLDKKRGKSKRRRSAAISTELSSTIPMPRVAAAIFHRH